ncbi:hypothetical protein ABV409_14465 [Flagellimonas sp. DF-77]|uniref:hypothetical protein n=1 Tax=Flagellimonas algarum TaxID=3230298 RepID=UPI003398D226
MKRVRTTFQMALFCALTYAQHADTNWYSSHEKNGVVFQNSYPKGGPYTGLTTEHFKHSYLVFYTRVVNTNEHPIDLALHFPAEAFPIPDSPTTFVKVLLPPDTMTLVKRDSMSYGLTSLASLDGPSEFKRTLKAKEECLFYTVALFFQTQEVFWEEARGGNRAEYLFDGKNVRFNMLPQIEALECGTVGFNP